MKIFNKKGFTRTPKSLVSGFTLMEILVVITIIAILSGVVIASISSSRNKSKDNAIKIAMAQMVGLMAMNFDRYGSYTNLQPGQWITESNCGGTNCTCDNISFNGIYTTQARAACREMFKNAGTWLNEGSRKVYFGTRSDFPSSAYFSFITALNNDKMYCVGSSGRKGEYILGDRQYDDPGCYGDP